MPAVGEVNGDRNNFAYSAWTRERSSMYGECQTIVDFKGKRAQPREEVRGPAARITLYMYEIRCSAVLHVEVSTTAVPNTSHKAAGVKGILTCDARIC